MPDPGNPKPNSARPSFTGFWKRSKDRQTTQNLTFVTSKLGQSTAHGEDGTQTEQPSAEAKAKERRQQVRKAQRQHRQRKANYTKQLEMDVTKLRDDIARVEREVERLRSQNGAIRSQLSGGDGGGEYQEVPASVNVSMPSVGMFIDGMGFSTSLAPEYTVSLAMSENLGTPAYSVRRASPSPSLPGMSSNSRSGSSVEDSSSRAPPETLGSATPKSAAYIDLEGAEALDMTLSTEQIDRVINFILALEHCCWDHIDQSCFGHHHRHDHQAARGQQQLAKKGCPFMRANTEAHVDDATGVNGHTLMATALALQDAPADVFGRIHDMQRGLEGLKSHPPHPPAPLEWSSRTLTLTNLRRLARTLNPSEAPELAPVQVWFELAARYGAAVATDGAVLDGLRAALATEVRCVVFGAAVARDVLEASLLRVIGSLPAQRGRETGQKQGWGRGHGQERDYGADVADDTGSDTDETEHRGGPDYRTVRGETRDNGGTPGDWGGSGSCS